MHSLLRRNRGFSVFLLTQGISNLGDAVNAVAVPLMLLQLTRSPVLVAALALLETVPRLVLQLPAGALVDRWDRRRTLLLTDVGRGLLTLVVPAAALAHGPIVLALFAIAAPLSVLSSLFGAGFAAMTPALVGRGRWWRAANRWPGWPVHRSRACSWPRSAARTRWRSTLRRFFSPRSGWP